MLTWLWVRASIRIPGQDGDETGSCLPSCGCERILAYRAEIELRPDCAIELDRDEGTEGCRAFGVAEVEAKLDFTLGAKHEEQNERLITLSISLHRCNRETIRAFFDEGKDDVKTVI